MSAVIAAHREARAGGRCRDQARRRTPRRSSTSQAASNPRGGIPARGAWPRASGAWTGNARRERRDLGGEVVPARAGRRRGGGPAAARSRRARSRCRGRWRGSSAWLAPGLALRLAFDLGGRGALDPQVAPPVVEQRHRVLELVGEGVDAPDEQVVIAGREGLDDRAFERRDRAVDQRQAGRPGMPGGPAERIATRFDRRARRSSPTAPAGPRTGC